MASQSLHSPPVSWRPTGGRRRAGLDRAESLRLLAGVPFGRISVVDQGLPIIRPVNHLVGGGYILVRTHRGGRLASILARSEPNRVVVAYEADAVDPASHVGWSVVVTGRLDLIVDPDAAARCRALLEPWADEVMDCVLRIHPDLVSGIRLTGRLFEAQRGGLVLRR
jgi:nitroimidazol reductase NimA-like FMN-containing flavoprotein (pyridoxamine 5'-phosphate oxidase superfamily)